MLYPLQIIVDSIFPPTNHELLLRTSSPQRFVSWYAPHTIGSIVCLSEYHQREVQAAVAACKFEHSYRAARLLSALVQKYLSELPQKKTVLIPIPLSRARKRARGFNQVERVLTYVQQLPYPYTRTTKILERVRHTPPQTSCNRHERLQNLNGAFALPRSQLWRLDTVERIIICDDVVTTGTTLTIAATELKKHLPQHIELICLAWAH